MKSKTAATPEKDTQSLLDELRQAVSNTTFETADGFVSNAVPLRTTSATTSLNNVYASNVTLGGHSFGSTQHNGLLNHGTLGGYGQISGGYTNTVGGSYVSGTDISTEMKTLVINVEKYMALDKQLKAWADEFFAAVDKSTHVSGKIQLLFTTLRTYGVLVERDAFERLRKLDALTEKPE